MMRTVLVFVLLSVGSLDAGAHQTPPERLAIPLLFEENRGQFPEGVEYGARLRGATALFSPEAVTFHLSETVDDGPSEASSPVGSMAILRFGGSCPSTVLHGLHELPAKTNYYIGREESGWIAGVPNFQRLRYEEIYPGVDVEFYESAAGLEFDFIVQPGADTSALRLDWEGLDAITIDERGAHSTVGRSILTLLPPVVYQPGSPEQRIAARYVQRSDREITIEVDDYDRERPLIVDPVITFSTFIGGSDDSDHIRAVRTDRVGNVYVGGHIYSTSFFGVTRPERQPDPFIMKITAAGEIEFLTVFGSPMVVSESVDDLEVDGAGNSYAIGVTRGPDFPLRNPIQSSLAGEYDGFIVKLDPAGAMLYSTYLGGSREDGAPSRIAVDRDGSIVVAMWTMSADLPPVDPIQDVRRGTDDVYLAKLSPQGDRILFSTYLGGTSSPFATNDYPSSLLIDDGGDIFVVGGTRSPDFPLHDALQAEHKGETDLFITKVRGDGSRILFSTFFGGSGGDGGITNARPGTLDQDGNLVLAFRTSSPDLPLVEAPLSDPASFYLARIRGDGTVLDLGTYLPAPPGFPPEVDSRILGVGAATTGSIYLAGYTNSPSLPLVNPIQEYGGGTNDSFVMKLNRDGTVAFSTYLGGSGADYLYSMALYPGGGVVLAGATGSPDFPLVNPIQPELIGDYDEWVAILRDPILIVDETRILPVVGSLPGALGSFFRTTVQLHNPLDEEVIGRFAFRRAGSSDEVDEPTLDLFLAPGQTRSYFDLLPAMGHSGIGSIDLLSGSTVPLAVARIFNDAGEAGTTGMSMEAMRLEDALQSGHTGYLLAPPDPARARFNIGIRTLGDGADLTFVVRAANGSVARQFSRSYDPDFFLQQSSADFLGIEISGNASISAEVSRGSAIVYGATTDNTTQDPSLQIATARSGALTRILPVVGSTPGQFGSFFRTTVQLHNPGEDPSEGRIVFHPADRSGTENDPSVSFALQPGQTIAYPDLLPEMDLSGIGSADLISTAGAAPIVTARIFNDAGEAGTTGMTEPAFALSGALGVGDTAILIAPPDPATARFNIGIRTLSTETTVTMRVRNAAGTEIWTATRTFPPQFFEQKSSNVFVGIALGGNDTVSFTIESGGAIIYGATTDNISQDPSLQIARASW